MSCAPLKSTPTKNKRANQGLPDGTTEEQLKETFGAFGEVKSIRYARLLVLYPLGQTQNLLI